MITKRNGTKEPLEFSKITKQTIDAVEGLGLSHEELELDAQISFSNEISSQDIQKILIQTAVNKIDVDRPNWTFVAARLTLYDLYHQHQSLYKLEHKSNIYDTVQFTDYFELNKDLLSYTLDGFDIAKLNKSIKPENDLLFTYLGVDTLISRYLLKSNDVIRELPQHMLMSIACFLAQNESDKTHWALKFYEQMSDLEVLLATPSLSNGRKKNGNCFSCFVGTTPDDLGGIFQSFSDQAQIGKSGGGIGWDWTRVRALGGMIQDYPGAAGGVVPFLKIENDIAIAVDQLGVRLGAINISMETWHKDILDFLDMKKNSGDESRRAKELFLTVSASDLFMTRAENDQDFTLFDPFDVRDLTELWGEEFESRYEYYEERFKSDPGSFTNQPITINAKDLEKKINNFYWETGMPFWFFKDTTNRAHANPELGIIRSSNLCMEFMNPVSDGEIAVCNLGSINLARVNTPEKLKYSSHIIVRMLDNIIDLSSYPTESARHTQMNRRSIGVGVCGEAELVATRHIHYASEEHLELIDEIYSVIRIETDIASMNLAVERGAWSPDSQYRNAYRRAIAPTSSISILFGTTPSSEPVYDRIWSEENNMGIFNVVVPNLNPDTWEYYRNAYEISQIDMVIAEARRQKDIDMGISHNIYFIPEETTGKDVHDVIMAAWKAGLKSLYYLRSRSADASKVRDTEAEIACFGCSG